MKEDPRPSRTVLFLALALSLAALVGVHHRAADGRNALLKWVPAQEALEAGEPIYLTRPDDPDGPDDPHGIGGRDAGGGYPTLPVTLLLLRPFHALGPLFGPLAWATLSLGLAWGIVLAAWRLAAGRARDLPTWGQLTVLAISFRVLHSQVQHANLDLVVGATVVAAFVAWARGRELTAGLALGLGAVLKVTPVLGVLWLVRKGSAWGLVGMVLGVALFALAVPALGLGWERNLELVARWWEQMPAPYLAGRELELLQTEQINQSLFGAMGRLLTDSLAIPARAPIHLEDVRVNLVALGPEAFRWAHRAALALVLIWLLARTAPREERRAPVVLAEASLLVLAMLLCSERSWKHHHVLLPLPLTLLVWVVARTSLKDSRLWVASLALLASAALFGLTGEAVLGPGLSDLAEAYGAFALGDLILLVAVGWLLGRLPRRTPPWTSPHRKASGPP